MIVHNHGLCLLSSTLEYHWGRGWTRIMNQWKPQQTHPNRAFPTLPLNAPIISVYGLRWIQMAVCGILINWNIFHRKRKFIGYWKLFSLWVLKLKCFSGRCEEPSSCNWVIKINTVHISISYILNCTSNRRKWEVQRRGGVEGKSEREREVEGKRG